MSSTLHLAPHASPRFRAFTPRDLDSLLQRGPLPPGDRLILRALSAVPPLRTNAHVVYELIGWSAVLVDRLESSDRTAP